MGTGAIARHSEGRKAKRNKDWRSFAAVLAVAVVAAAGAVPLSAMADDHHPEGLGFEIAEPVPGRRVFVEGLTVEGDRAMVTVRGATDVDLRVRAYGGAGGRVLVHREISDLGKGERKTYTLPLSGDAPSLTFSWRDRLGQTGAVSVKGGEIPYPLPAMEGRTLRPEGLVPGLESRVGPGHGGVGVRGHGWRGCITPHSLRPRERDGGRGYRCRNNRY